MVQRERLDKELRVALDDVAGFEREDILALESVGVHTLKELVSADETALVQDKGLDPDLVARTRSLASQRASEIQAAFAEKRAAESKLFDEAMFDRVGGEEAEETARPATLTFRDESEMEESESEDEGGGDELAEPADAAAADALAEDVLADDTPVAESSATPADDLDRSEPPADGERS